MFAIFTVFIVGAFGDAVFIASSGTGIGVGGAFASSDGVLWTKLNVTCGTECYATTYSMYFSRWYMVGRQRYHGAIVTTSRDGYTFTDLKVPAFAVGLCVASGGGRVTIGSNRQILTSTDGVTFQLVSVPLTVKDVATNGKGRWVISGQNNDMTAAVIGYSDDGVNFSYVSNTLEFGIGAGTYYSSLASKFLAFGRGGVALPYMNVGYSETGSTWNLSQAYFAHTYWSQATEAFGRNIYVAATSKIFASPDGIVWADTSPFHDVGVPLSSIAYSSKLKLLAAVGTTWSADSGRSSKIITSKDAYSWNEHELPAQVGINFIAAKE